MSGPQVLLVDDEPKWIEGVASWLRRRGCVVRRAQNASRAIELLHEIQPDLVWLDIYLEPGSERLERQLRRIAQEHWGGLLVLEEIARLPAAPLLVVVTGSVTNVMAIKRACPMDFRLVGKPFDAREVRTVLVELLGDRLEPEAPGA